MDSPGSLSNENRKLAIVYLCLNEKCFMKRSGFILFLTLLLSCSDSATIQLTGIKLTDITGKQVSAADYINNRLVVFIFLSPDCPLCINYTQTLNEMHSRFRDSSIEFIAIFPGTYYELSEIKKFKTDYSMEFAIYLDPELSLTQKLNATVTPEAILLSAQGKKIYSGVIDNRVYEIGKKSSVITQNYLEHAITSALKGIAPEPAQTDPIGCYIEL